MDSQWLKVQFELNPGKSKADLARALNLEPPAISKILSGNRQIKAQEYLEMRKFFNLPVDGEKAVGQPVNQYRLSTLGPASMSDVAGANNQQTPWVMPASVFNQRTNASPEDIKIFQIQEKTMEPDYNLGEHVVIDLSNKTPSPPGVFIISDGFGHLIRQCEYIPKSNPPEIKISALKQGFQPQILKEQDFKIIGKVIAKVQWV